jgi:superfamily I DNA and/or RNA helicase
LAQQKYGMLLDRYDNILKGIELERRHEESYFWSLSKQKSLEEKIESGICWSPCDVLKSYFTIGEKVEVQFERRLRKLQPHKLRTGAACMAYLPNQDDHEYKGVISFMRKDKIGIIFSNDRVISDKIFLSGQVCIELVYDERPYRIMKQAIESLKSSNNTNASYLRDGIVNKDVFDGIIPDRHSGDIDYLPLNDSQKIAVKHSLQADAISIIHGPPGTGKTTTLVQLIRILLQFEKRILVCAPSNNATDLLARQLDEINLNVVRVGNVSRISNDTAHLSLPNLAANTQEWQHIKKVKIAADEASKKAKKYKRVFGEQERKERKMLRKESRDLRKWARELEDKLVLDILSQSQVICSTLIGAASREITDMHFDTVVIDEASQALEAECWNVISKANKVILAGDHFQLPPTVMSNEAKDLGFNTTLLDLLAGQIKFSSLLNTQYRMNWKILSFPNLAFYDNKLLSEESVKDRFIDADKEGITFIDTAGAGFEEAINPETRSRWNEGEYFILREHFLLNSELYTDQTIGVICPYSEQVKFIREQVENDACFRDFSIEVNSIDGFQGQEKDVIYISLVRSNDKADIGFLSDQRRFNVALTRAKKKLVVIGDSTTLAQHQLFSDWIDHMDKLEAYQSAWQYMTNEY